MKRFIALSLLGVLSLSNVMAVSNEMTPEEKLDYLMGKIILNKAELQVTADEDVKALTKCIRKQVRSKKFDDSKKDQLIALAASTLDNGKLTNDRARILKAADACKDGESITSESDEASILKARVLIKHLEKPTYVCVSYSAEVSAALLIGAGIGGAVYKCQGSDSTIRLYAGPKLMASVGIGANATVHRRTAEHNIQDHLNNVDNSPLAKVMYGAELQYGMVVARSADQAAIGLGLGVNYNGFMVLTARVGSLPSKWTVAQSFLQN